MVEDDELREDLPERAGRRNIPSTKWPVHWPPAGCSGCSLPRPSGRFWAARGRAIEDRPGAGGVPSRRAEMRKRQRTLLPRGTLHEKGCMRLSVRPDQVRWPLLSQRHCMHNRHARHPLRLPQ